ncbi:MAG TPA: endonuclease/exonuclease/phosphatase family protein [Polyangiaceae bacterium]|nr:endonuclease/exonuclease/phosphatase family protein [Polyangiaceae bacterium]
MRVWFRRSISLVALAYPVVLSAIALALHLVGERWWLTGASLYLPRILFAAPLPVIVVATLACRMRRLAAAQLLSAALILFPLMGLVLPAPRFTRRSGPTIRVLSLNADSARAGVETLVAAIDGYSPDLVLLQEVYGNVTSRLASALRARYPNVDTTDQFVVASRLPLSSVVTPDRFLYDSRPHSARYMRYVATTPFGPVVIYNVHPISPRQGFYSLRGAGLRREIASGRLFEGAAAPVVQANSGLRAAELEALSQDVRQQQGPVLVAGDTNLPGLSPLLRWLTDGYQDGFEKAGWGFGYTFPSGRPWMRIDRMFASSQLTFDRFEVGCAGASDHLCVVADLRRSPR